MKKENDDNFGTIDLISSYTAYNSLVGSYSIPGILSNSLETSFSKDASGFILEKV